MGTRKDYHMGRLSTNVELYGGDPTVVKILVGLARTPPKNRWELANATERAARGGRAKRPITLPRLKFMEGGEP